MQSLCHFGQQTYIWIIHFVNGHVIQFSKEQYLIYSSDDQHGVLIFKSYHFIKENSEPNTECSTVPLDLSLRVHFRKEQQQKKLFACWGPAGFTKAKKEVNTGVAEPCQHWFN